MLKCAFIVWLNSSHRSRIQMPSILCKCESILKFNFKFVTIIIQFKTIEAGRFSALRAASVNVDSSSGSGHNASVPPPPPPPPRVAPMYEWSEMQTTDANGDRVTVPFVTLPLLGPSLSDVRHRGHALPAACMLVRRPASVLRGRDSGFGVIFSDLQLHSCPRTSSTCRIFQSIPFSHAFRFSSILPLHALFLLHISYLISHIPC